MKANYVNLSSPEQTKQDLNYIDEAPSRIQSIVSYLFKDEGECIDAYALGFSDATARLRCFDGYEPQFTIRQQERWVCRIIHGVKDASK